MTLFDIFILGQVYVYTNIYSYEKYVGIKRVLCLFLQITQTKTFKLQIENKMSLLRKLTSCYIRRLAMVPNSKSVQPIQQARFMSSKSEETDAEFDARYEAYFNRPDIDGWEVSC